MNDTSFDDRSLSEEISNLVRSGYVFTDLMIEQDMPVMVRTPQGWEVSSDIAPASAEDIGKFLLMLDPNWEGEIKEHAMNRPFTLMDWRLRVNAYKGYRGEKLMMSVRVNPARPIPFNKTGLPPQVRLLLDNPRGLILLTGSTGSGKSTSLASMVQHINDTRSAHVITIEDPIEFQFVRNKCVFSQREIGSDVGTFYEGMRDAVRQRPDVIVVGEIRDRDTAATALLAAESGVLVLGTVHANSAPSAIRKMLSFFTPDEQAGVLESIGINLIGVIAQLLIPTPDRGSWVLACELLANHKQQITKFIGSPESLERHMESGDDDVSCSMISVLAQLIDDGKVDKADAMRNISAYYQKQLLHRIGQE